MKRALTLIALLLSASATHGLAGQATATGITLTWNAPVVTPGFPVDSYKVMRGACGQESLLATVTATGYVDTAVQPGQTFCYTVVSVSGTALAPPSNEISVTFQPTPQTSPTTGYTKCADEGGQCAFTGTADVMYGAGTSFVHKTFTNGTACTNAVFTDPAQGTVKACYFKLTTPPPVVVTPPVLPITFTMSVLCAVGVTIDATGNIAFGTPVCSVTRK